MGGLLTPVCWSTALQRGSAADIIMAEAFQALTIEPAILAKEQIPQLIGSISEHLDPDETATFTQWVLKTV